MNRDTLRQIWVTLCALVCAAGPLIGFGIIGDPVEESSGGSLSDNATHLAPDGPAFSIWSVIYLGLFAYTIWQWLPRNKTAERARATGWLAGLTMLLNGAWLLVTQQDLIWLSVVVIVVLALSLGFLVRALGALPNASVSERIVVDGTFGLYLGWVTVATCANIAAAGADSGWSFGETGDQIVAVIVIAAAAGLGVLFAHQFGGRLAVAAAIAWGLAWIAVGRLGGDPESTLVAVAAVIAALVVVAGALFFRRTRGTSPRAGTPDPQGRAHHAGR